MSKTSTPKVFFKKVCKGIFLVSTFWLILPQYNLIRNHLSCFATKVREALLTYTIKLIWSNQSDTLSESKSVVSLQCLYDQIGLKQFTPIYISWVFFLRWLLLSLLRKVLLEKNVTTITTNTIINKREKGRKNKSSLINRSDIPYNAGIS